VTAYRNITTLQDLDDVPVAAPANGQVPIWDAATSKFVWRNQFTRTRVSLLNSIDQTLTNNVDAPISFDTEVEDTDVFHDGANPTRITIPAGLGGLYGVTVIAVFATNAVGSRWVHVRKNNVTDVLSFTTIPPALETQLVISAEVDFVASDYIELRMYQTSGGNLSAFLSNAHAQRTTFTIRRIG
jgi:hypothetical protein